MSFWGVEIRPGRPYVHIFDEARGRLHVSQATIGFSTNLQKSIVQCNVGDKSPVLLCRLIPDRTECCVLALEFEEEDEVVFSVIGSRSVHLTGYYLGRGSAHIHDNDEDYDLHGRDLNENDSERSSEQEEESDDDFIDDGELEIFPPSPAPKSKVVIEDILEDERPANTNVFRKRLRRKYHVSDSESNDDVKIVHKAGTRIFDVPSEVEDGRTVEVDHQIVVETEVEKKSEEKIVVETKLEAENADDLVTSAKKKIEGVRTCETEREVEQPNASSLPYLEIGHENTEKRKKKKKKRAREGKTGGVKHDENNNISQVEPVRDEVNEKPFAHKTVNESAEVKEKFNKKVVKASKKKDKDEFDQVTDAKSKSVDVGGDEVERTEDVSAEVKVKSDETVAMEVAKKAEDEDDLLVSSQTKTRGQSTVLEEKSDEKVVIETKKKAEDEDDLSVASLTKTHGLNAEVEEKSVEKVVIETKKKAEDEDYLPVASLTKTHGLNAEVEEKSDEKIVIETKNAEHDDDFPISFLSKTQAPSAEAEEKSGETVVVEIKKNAEDAGVLVTSAKRKIEEVQHCETEREVEQLNGFSLPSLELGHETKDKQKKPKKKERAKEGKSGGVGDDKANDISQESIRDEVNEKHITHKTQNGSEVKEKSDMKVVESCKKKDKDGIDLENEDKNDLRISSLSMAKGQSSEVEDKSDKNVVMESKKKAEAGDALPVKEVQDFETERSREVVQPTKCQTSEVGQETNEKRKKRKRKERTKLGKTGGVGDDKTVDITKEQPVKEELKEKPFTHKTKSGSAEVKEKSDNKVVKASKKKGKDDIDQVIEANKKSPEAKDCDVERTEDGSVEVKENSVKEVVKARKKNAEDGVDHVTGVKKKTVDVKESETERIDENAKAANLVAGENTAERKKKKKRKIDKTLISDGNAKAKKESAMET